MTASSAQPPRSIDWCLGHYEHTAAQLLPAARAVVDRAAPAAGERVVDVGCGTGNAALLAAARGAHVTGVDPAPRLVQVARERAPAHGLDATPPWARRRRCQPRRGHRRGALCLRGDLRPQRASRSGGDGAVTARAGRIVLSAWVPEGAIHDAAHVAQEAVRRAVGAPAAAAIRLA
jgi:SAM-dependent methyltransferase